jgi:hypothetical protein
MIILCLHRLIARMWRWGAGCSLTNKPGDVFSARHPLLTYHHHPHLYIGIGMVMMGL